MFRIFFIPIIFVLSFSQVIWADISPFDLLKKRFQKSYLPHEMHFKPGQLWHCSGSLEAAKGHFRNVQFWSPSYSFYYDREKEELINRGPHIIKRVYFNNDEAYGVFDCPSCTTLKKQSFRVTLRGDLVLAHYKMQKKQINRRKHRGKKKVQKSEPVWIIDHYSVCENPGMHESQDWDSDQNIWSDL